MTLNPRRASSAAGSAIEACSIALIKTVPVLQLFVIEEKTQLFDSVAPDVKLKQSGSSALISLASAAAAMRRGTSAPVKAAVEDDGLK